MRARVRVGTRAWVRLGARLRCAPPADNSLRSWSPPEFINSFNPHWATNKHEPYDPVRPWVDSDGLWYGAVSLDACNKSADYHHCGAGAALDMFRSPALRGPKADCKIVILSRFVCCPSR